MNGSRSSAAWTSTRLFGSMFWAQAHLSGLKQLNRAQRLIKSVCLELVPPPGYFIPT